MNCCNTNVIKIKSNLPTMLYTSTSKNKSKKVYAIGLAVDLVAVGTRTMFTASIRSF